MAHRVAPLVSVLIPARNAGRTLASCLNSVLRQREARGECLIVADGSIADLRQEMVRKILVLSLEGSRESFSAAYHRLYVQLSSGEGR